LEQFGGAIYFFGIQVYKSALDVGRLQGAETVNRAADGVMKVKRTIKLMNEKKRA
jgi:hypothetical protein